MHKEIKWCAVLVAVVIAIATIAVTAFQVVPASAMAAEVAVPEDSQIAQLAESQGIQPANEGAEAEVEETASTTVEIADLAADFEPAEAGIDGVSDVVSVTLKVDGQAMELMTAPVTVADMLEIYNIPLGKDDIVTPAADQTLIADTEIVVERITFEEVIESEAIPFKTKTKGTDELPAGTTKVVQKGQKGEDKVTYKITYSDGKEVSRKEIARETVKKPVTKIIAKSTVGTIAGAEYSRKFTVKAYSYTGGGTTASGLPAAVGRIAVDPSVIPLGTRVYVEGYGFATAADTGGNINGNTIDVYYNSESQCRSWGCRYITVYILK